MTETEAGEKIDDLVRGMVHFFKVVWAVLIRYSGTVLTLIGGVFVAVTPHFIAEKVNWWIIGIVFLGVVISSLVAITQDVLIRDLRLNASVEQEIAREHEAMAVSDILYPAIERLEYLRKRTANSNSAEKIEGKYESLVETVVGGLKGYFGNHGKSVTVNYYRLCKEDDYYYLKVPDNTFQVSRSELRMSDPEGLEIVKRTLEGKPEYCPDIRDRTLPEGVHSERKYRCFVSHPALVDGEIHGMVSMNTAEPEGLNEQRALAYLMAFGAILASAEAAFKQSTPHVKGESFKLPGDAGILTGEQVPKDQNILSGSEGN